MLATWLIVSFNEWHPRGTPKGSFSVITLDQHVIHSWTRVINVKSQLSKSLEPKRITPRRIANAFKVQVEEKLKES